MTNGNGLESLALTGSVSSIASRSIQHPEQGESFYDPDIESFIVSMRDNPVVNPANREEYFSKEAIEFCLGHKVLPYLYNANSGKMTFALDDSYFSRNSEGKLLFPFEDRLPLVKEEEEVFTLGEFRLRYSEVFGIMPLQMARKTSDDKNLEFNLIEHDKLIKIAYFAKFPEEISNYFDEKNRINAEKIRLKNIDDHIIDPNSKANLIVRTIINWAIEQKASDIHFEVEGSKYRVRCRIDGELQEYRELLNSKVKDEKNKDDKTPSDPGALYRQTIAVLKNMCGEGVRVEEKRKPQDGRITFPMEGRDGKLRDYDLRVAFTPTVRGEENAILRIIERGAFKALGDAGFCPYDFDRIKDICSEPNGIILVTGATGSGKTTTLYAMINEMNKIDTKIVTIEDPVEILMNGVQQTQVHSQIGIDFTSFMRHVLRQDPDVVLVGELRDAESAMTAMQASETGHLVLSTLHTNDAPGTIDRLIHLGIPRYYVADNLRGVISQKLVPVFRKDLQEKILTDKLTIEDRDILQGYDGSEELNELIGEEFFIPGKYPLFRGSVNLFSGRTAMTEFWYLDDASREVISNPASNLSAFSIAAEKSGMRPLFISGIEKVVNQTTSMDKVVKLVGKHIFKTRKDCVKRFFPNGQQFIEP